MIFHSWDAAALAGGDTDLSSVNKLVKLLMLQSKSSVYQFQLRMSLMVSAHRIGKSMAKLR